MAQLFGPKAGTIIEDIIPLQTVYSIIFRSHCIRAHRRQSCAWQPASSCPSTASITEDHNAGSGEAADLRPVCLSFSRVRLAVSAHYGGVNCLSPA